MNLSIRAVLRFLLAVFFAAACVLHLRGTEALVAITPDFVPFKREVVIATGFLELAGGLALLVPRLRRVAGIALALYALAVWPANFRHAFEHIVAPPVPDSWWYHAPRLAFQPVFVWWALFCGGATSWPFRKRSVT